MIQDYFNKGFDKGYYTCKLLYAKKWQQLQDNLISEEEWIEFCNDTFIGILEEHKDVFMRLKDR